VQVDDTSYQSAGDSHGRRSPQEAGRHRLCELVDGVLVEKTAGYYESLVAGLVVHFLNRFVIDRDLGDRSGRRWDVEKTAWNGAHPRRVFHSWDKLPGRKLPAEPIPDLVPDLAIEILSAGNTKKEMQRKLREYFEAGVRLVWSLIRRPAARRLIDLARRRRASARMEF
jgi:Uma2 family endonuclease